MSNKQAVAQQGSLEYADVLIRLWSDDIPAFVKVLSGSPVIMIDIPPTTGFFMLYDVDARPLPVDRADQTGWQLVFFPPDTDDPDELLNEGADLFVTDNPDVDIMLDTVIPTVQLISKIVGRG